MRRIAALLALTPCLAACAGGGGGAIAVTQPPVGTNEVLRGPIEAARGLELVVGDLVFGRGAPIPRHYHHGEEFLYVIGGETTVSRPGVPDVLLRPGDSLRIAPGTVHWGSAGSEGVRAVSSWVAVQGQPLRVMVPE
jgi:quercetin dioxygenase-like cupin family protein